MIHFLLLAFLQAKACETAPALWSGGVLAQAKQEVPPDPELERKTFKVAEGFEVTLFAADPLIAKPIQINFDHRGRLWVATSSVYPQVLPGEVPNDKIVILEETQGLGKADKSMVWAEASLFRLCPLTQGLERRRSLRRGRLRPRPRHASE